MNLMYSMQDIKCFKSRKKCQNLEKKKKVVEQKLFTQIRYYNVFITEKSNFNYFIFKHFFLHLLTFFFVTKKLNKNNRV